MLFQTSLITLLFFSNPLHDLHQFFISCLTGCSIEHLQVTAVHNDNHIVRGIAVKTHVRFQPAMKPKRLFFKVGLDCLQFILRKPIDKLLPLEWMCFVNKKSSKSERKFPTFGKGIPHYPKVTCKVQFLGFAQTYPSPGRQESSFDCFPYPGSSVSLVSRAARALRVQRTVS